MELLLDGPAEAGTTVLLAHGAGAPMDSPAMTAIAQALAGAGLRAARFEFGYMAARRSGARRPPPRAETLIPENRAAVSALGAAHDAPRPVIGGKSMGGRVASMLADALCAEEAAAGLLCIGYPFHPPGRPERPRTAHLETLRAPALIVQGTRDPFGTRDEVAAYALSPAVELLWLEDGDHDLRPRRKVTGLTATDHLRTMGAAVAAWAARLA
jgi:predicted alpha/beta-hydrolase family hydrolase